MGNDIKESPKMFPNSVVNWHRVGVDGGVYNNQAWKYSEVRKTIIHDVIAQLVELPIFERGNIGETRVL